MAVNWKKGFRRITLVCSLLAAIAGGVTGFEIASNSPVLQNARQLLKSAEESYVSESSLLEEWDKPLERQNSLWKYWTGEDLNSPGDKYLLTTSLPVERRMALKEQGWQTANGDELPYPPFVVSSIIRDRNQAQAQYNLRKGQLLFISRALLIGGALGFGSVWIVYLILEHIVSWLARGFHGVDATGKSVDKEM